jgi:hypothetical protein
MKYIYLILLLCPFIQAQATSTPQPALTQDERAIVDSVVTVVDTYGNPTVTPAAAAELQLLAQALQDARIISLNMPVVLCVFIAAIIPLCLGWVRFSLSLSLIGFAGLYMVPLVLFQFLALIGFGITLTGILLLTYRSHKPA